MASINASPKTLVEKRMAASDCTVSTNEFACLFRFRTTYLLTADTDRTAKKHFLSFVNYT